MNSLPKRLDQYDFLKGVAIVFVLLLHSLSREVLWLIHSNYSIGQAVPLFILCTFVLSFNSLFSRERYIKYWFSKSRVHTLWRKIIKPFLIVQFLLMVLLLLSGNSDKLINLIKNAGLGPGSYYPWIYLQFWLLIPFLYGLFKNVGIFWAGGIILIVSQMLQYACSVLEMPEEIYRLLCFRYVFLGVLAYLISKYSIKPIWNILFFLIGVGYYIFLDMEVKFTPWLYNSWMSQQLPAYFYTIVVFSLLIAVYNRFSKKQFVKIFMFLGKRSWEIFLLQMFFISVISSNRFKVVENEWINSLFYVFCVFAISILPILGKDYINKKHLKIEEKNII